MIDRRRFLAGAAIGSAAAALSPRAVAVAASSNARNVVLVHGAYADGSCWSEVIARLQPAGLKPMAVQNPLNSFAEDCAYTRRILDQQDGPTVLVAHSYGGEVITEVGDHANVSALVYIAARAPDAGEDYTALAKTFPIPPASAGLIHTGGYAQLGEETFLRDFANGVDPAKARILYAVQGRTSDSLFSAKVTRASWRSKPCFYAVSKQDRTINADLERFMARRMKATTIEIDTGHLSLISHPDEVVNLIRLAARA